MSQMELVRYRPGEAIRWIQVGADNMRRQAKTRGKSVVGQTGTDQRNFGENVKTAAGAIFEYGKSAYADVLHRQAEASEYVLEDDHFDIVSGSSMRSVSYDRVKQVQVAPDRAKVILDKGNIMIKPVAFIVAGRVRVPIGWTRNGIEVPFELLLEELSARCNLDPEEE